MRRVGIVEAATRALASQGAKAWGVRGGLWRCLSRQHLCFYLTEPLLPQPSPAGGWGRN